MTRRRKPAPENSLEMARWKRESELELNLEEWMDTKPHKRRKHYVGEMDILRM